MSGDRGAAGAGSEVAGEDILSLCLGGDEARVDKKGEVKMGREPARLRGLTARFDIAAWPACRGHNHEGYD